MAHCIPVLTLLLRVNTKNIFTPPLWMQITLCENNINYEENYVILTDE